MKRYVVLAEPLNDGGMLCEAKSVNAIAIFGSHPPLVPLWTWQRRRVISTSCVACSEPTAGGWIEDYQGVLNWAENIRVFSLHLLSFSSDDAEKEDEEKPLHNK